MTDEDNTKKIIETVNGILEKVYDLQMQTNTLKVKDEELQNKINMIEKRITQCWEQIDGKNDKV